MNRFFDDYFGDAYEMEEFMTRRQREGLTNGRYDISHLIPGDEFFSSQGYENYTSERVAPITKEHVINYYK